MKSPEEFISEITLGNASTVEIKRYIREQAKELSELRARIELIEMRRKEREYNRKMSSLKKFLREV